MNRNLCFCIAFMLCTVLPLHAQDKSPDGVKKAEPKRGRIERVKEKDDEIIRFFDKDGKKTREVRLGERTHKVRINKSKRFNRASLKVNVSKKVADIIESARKESGRDIELHRQESHWSSMSGDGNFVSVIDNYADYIEVADARDDERSEGATEIASTTTIYDLAGNKILELSKDEGWQPVVSNTGQFFVVTLGEYEKSRLIAQDKRVLAEFDGVVAPVFFSMNDRYALLLHFDPQADSKNALLTVYDTLADKLESKKLSIPWRIFSSNETPEINEETRTIIIRHKWDSIKKTSEVDTVHF